VERSARLFHECSLFQAPQPNVLYPMTELKMRAGEKCLFDAFFTWILTCAKKSENNWQWN
jgi:hypothetical protein